MPVTRTAGSPWLKCMHRYLSEQQTTLQTQHANTHPCSMGLSLGKRRSKIQQPTLPFEIIEQVIAHLDPFDDGGRHALITCMRASRACWPVAGKVLYHHVVVSRKRMVALLAGYRRRRGISPRAITIFGFIHRLTFIGDLGRAVVSLFDMARRVRARDGAALFPNIRQLSVRDAQWSVVSRWSDRDDIPWYLPPHGHAAVLFDRLDV